jgi:hypothetical protein
MDVADEAADELDRLTTENTTLQTELDKALADLVWCEANGGSETPLPGFPRLDPALFGVRVFPQYSDKTYGQHAAVLDILAGLGTKRVSGLLTPNMDPEVLSFYQNAAALGIRFWFTCGEPNEALTDAQWANIRDLLTGPLWGMVDVVSGWNEPNHNADGNPGKTVKHGKQLRTHIDTVNTESSQTIRVGTAQLWSGDIDEQFTYLADMVEVGLVKADYDLIVWHLYMRPQPDVYVLDPALLEDQEATFRSILADDTTPVFCSEAGYFTAANYSGGSNPTTELQQAVLIPQLGKWYADRGYLLCDFELLNDPDPQNNDREANFGKVRTPEIDPTTWTPKPSYLTVKVALRP